MRAGWRAPNATLAAALQACRRHFLAAAGFSALINLLFLAPMLYMLQVYDRVVPTRGALTLLFATLALAVALVALSLLDWVRSRLLVRASVRLDRQLAQPLLDAGLALRTGEGGPGARQAVRDFDVLRQALTGPSMLALFDAPWSPVYVLICFLIHPAIGALVLAGAGVLVLLTLRNEKLTHGPLHDANLAARKAYADQDRVTADADIVRALGMRRALVRRHLADRETMMALQSRASMISSRYVTASKFLRLMLQSLSLGLGAWLAIGNSISVGAIFAASFLAGRALAPIDQLLGSWRTVVQARDAYAALGELLAGEEQVPPTRLPAPAGRITLEGVTVRAPVGDAAILSDIAFDVKPGEVVAVVGPSGSGKSTLLRAIAGAAPTAGGTIRFDGASIGDWDPERLAVHIGYLPQETVLFGGSVRDNISRFEGELGGDAEAIDAAVVEAAKASGAHALIQHLPKGYDTLLGPGGRGISAGQAQRIGLARAVYRAPAMLLLDEPNAHLDAEGESQLVATIAAAKARGASVLIAAHRMGVLGVVDRILLLRAGRIEAFGPRDEVIGRLQAVRGAKPATAKEKAAGA
ncbi:type I secretion system permease/ATPase [Sphingomonas sp.]|uniref:type I secretion system permease/ATPase n=1 Tax=Sphingomonas sp. TaxID=28214 RepID=UPI0031CF03B5